METQNLERIRKSWFQSIARYRWKWRNLLGESLKGRHKFTYRIAKKRGEKDKKRGILNHKNAVVVAQDRNGKVIARKAGTGSVKAEENDFVIGEYIHQSALLCTDTATNYKKFAKLKGLLHETVNEC